MPDSGIKILATRGHKEVLVDIAVEDLPRLLKDRDILLWFDCWGTDTAEAERLAREVFQFHPLVIQDCFEAREHPKIEAFDDYVFLITHGVGEGSTALGPQTVELDTFFGKRFVFTYHEVPSRSVAGVMELVLRNQGGPLRRGPAHLVHAILDRQVDNIEPLLDDLEERVQMLEDKVLRRPRATDLTTLLALKRATLQLRRWMSRQREVVLRLSRNEFELVGAQESLLFRDAYDHLSRFTEQVETDREMVTSLQESYLSVTNLRLGEIMKFLTVFTAVLMPLTVITGIYGMNFDHMPELRRPWGYPAVLGLMAFVALGVLWLFRRRGWLGKDKGPSAPPPP